VLDLAATKPNTYPPSSPSSLPTSPYAKREKLLAITHISYA